MDKALKLTLIAGILIIALSVAFYLVIFLPQKEEKRLELQQESKKLLTACLDESEKRFMKSTEGLAKMKREGRDFDLAGSIAEASVDNDTRKSDCYKIFPQ